MKHDMLIIILLHADKHSTKTLPNKARKKPSNPLSLQNHDVTIRPFHNFYASSRFHHNHNNKRNK